MTPRPFYRSRLFWFGLPGLVFLLWAWGSSNVRTIAFHHAPWEFKSAHGEVMLLRLKTNPSTPPSATIVGRGGKTFGIIPAGSQHAILWTKLKWFPWCRYRSGILGPGSDFTFISFPYWPALAIYVTAWFGMVIAWQRRKARLLQLHASPAP